MVYNLNLTLFSTLLLYQKRHAKITLEFPHQLKLQVFHVKFWFLSCCVFRYQKDKDYHNLLATTSFLYSLKTFKFNELIQKSTCSLLLLLISQLLRINKLHFKVAHFKVVYLKPEKSTHHPNCLCSSLKNLLFLWSAKRDLQYFPDCFIDIF